MHAGLLFCQFYLVDNYMTVSSVSSHSPMHVQCEIRHSLFALRDAWKGCNW